MQCPWDYRALNHTLPKQAYQIEFDGAIKTIFENNLFGTRNTKISKKCFFVEPKERPDHFVALKRFYNVFKNKHVKTSMRSQNPDVW